MSALQVSAVLFAVWLVWFVPESRRVSRRMDAVREFRRQMDALGDPKEIR